MPPHVARFVVQMVISLSEEEFNSPKYAYRVLSTQKTANRSDQADKVIEFIELDSKAAKNINTAYALVKEKEKTKHLPTQIVKMMQDDGYPNFKMTNHINLWKKMGAKTTLKVMVYK